MKEYWQTCTTFLFYNRTSETCDYYGVCDLLFFLCVGQCFSKHSPAPYLMVLQGVTSLPS